MAGATDINQQLPQLEALCERLYNSQASFSILKDTSMNLF
jgi:hypothetical protein